MAKKKLLMVIIAVCMVSAVGFTACSGGGNSTTGATFTFWLGNGADTVYYPDYSQNPAVNYITTQKTWGPNDIKIDIEFQIPPAGSQLDSVVTMMGTGDYTDLVDMSYYTNAGSVLELYQDGIAVDLTPYMEEYFPNYLSFLERFPDYAKTATNVVDGEKKYLQLYAYHDQIDQWGGWQYRRDWLVKYGTNPDTGKPFTGGYAAPGDVDTWTDDVVFPSGGSDPIYISDWEWMLDIFATALEEEGIKDGYPISLPYQGYNETGDLLCAFGGGGGGWYLNGDTVEFGGDNETMRTYLQAMSTWYKNGWIDTAFAEHTSDIFFRIDSVKLHQGKVGLFYEADGLLGSNLDISEGQPNSPETGYTNGIMVFGCRQPINDIYGGPEQQGVIPYTMYQVSVEYIPMIVTEKAMEKDWEALFDMLDYLYSEEGATLTAFGLSKEQFEATQDEAYIKYGLTEGAYTVEQTEDGEKYKFVDELALDTNLQKAMRGDRLISLQNNSKKYPVGSSVILHAKEEWQVYVSTGFFQGSFNSQRTTEQNKTYSKTVTNVREFMSKNIPNFINGNKDPYNDDDWAAYVNAVNKYNPQQNVDIMQNIYDSLN